MKTYSAHWLAHPQFSAAIEDVLQREARDISIHIDELGERSPFKQTPAIAERNANA